VGQVLGEAKASTKVVGKENVFVVEDVGHGIWVQFEMLIVLLLFVLAPNDPLYTWIR
jgi:hypothetical protein